MLETSRFSTYCVRAAAASFDIDIIASRSSCVDAHVFVLEAQEYYVLQSKFRLSLYERSDGQRRVVA